MASENVLLGSGKPVKVVREEKSVPAKLPTWRYHKTCPEGVVVKTETKLAELDAAGWVDHPGKVRKLPGFEHLFQEEVEEEVVVEVPEEVTTEVKHKKGSRKSIFEVDDATDSDK